MLDRRDRRFVATLAVAVAASVPLGVLVARVVGLDRWEYAAVALQLGAAPGCWWLAFVRFERPDAGPIELDAGERFCLRIGTTAVALSAAYALAPETAPGWLLAAAPAAVVGTQHWYLNRASWIDLGE